MVSARQIAAVVAVALVVAGVGVAYTNGVGPFPGGEGAEDDIEEPDSRGEVVELGDDGTPEVDEGEDPPAFTLKITDISECGTTCRDVSVALSNEMEEDATNVTVYTWIYAGQGTDGDQVWSNSRDVGTLSAGDTLESTDRVDVGLGGGNAIRSEDGWITIETTVESDQETVTFVREEQVM